MSCVLLKKYFLDKRASY
jgi:hypothetical protein